MNIILEIIYTFFCFQCCSPADLIDGAQSGKLRLANPQYYEATRLSNFSDAESLSSFASQRGPLGCYRIMPVQERAKDGLLFLLPGDYKLLQNLGF